MSPNRRSDVLGGLISFGIEALIIVVVALVAAVLAWSAIALVG